MVDFSVGGFSGVFGVASDFLRFCERRRVTRETTADFEGDFEARFGRDFEDFEVSVVFLERSHLRLGVGSGLGDFSGVFERVWGRVRFGRGSSICGVG